MFSQTGSKTLFVNRTGSRTIAPEKNCFPNLKLTLALTQTLILTRGNFPDTNGNYLLILVNMCSDLLIDKICSWKWYRGQLYSGNVVKFAEKYQWRSLLLRKLQYLESPPFWRKRTAKYNFLGIYGIFSVTGSTDLDCKMWFQ